MNKGLLIVVSGPSGCGKGTVLAEVLKDPQFFYSVSATTRKPRDGEIDGVNYYFYSKEEFEDLMAKGGVLEYAEYCGNYYGTPKQAVEEKLSQGKNVILEIEVQGAMKIKKSRPDAVFVFILPPSLNELRRRLNKRGTEAQDVIERRLSEAAGEIRTAFEYDYIIINDDVEKAAENIKTVIAAEKLSIKNSENKINEVLENA